MKKLFDVSEFVLPDKRVPVAIDVDVNGEEFTAYFLPLTRFEFDEILKKERPDDHLIAQTMCDESGVLAFENNEQVKKLKPKIHSKLSSCAMKASGFGDEAKAEAKKG